MSADSEFSLRIVGQTGRINPLAGSADRHRQKGDAASPKDHHDHHEDRPADDDGDDADERRELPARPDGDDDSEEGRIDYLV